MKRVLILALLCASMSSPTMAATARLGQKVYVDGLRVRPIKVLSDSRCPMNARCIWAGEVKLRVVVRGGQWRIVRTLTLGKPEPVADGTLTLTDVSPPRETSKTIKPGEYRFAFSFEGGL
jgi:hypothetical protein